MRTLQGQFDKMVEHMAAQKERAKDDYGCQYRTDDGRACAIGCLISDEKAKGLVGSVTMRWHTLHAELEIEGVATLPFYNSMQMAHDFSKSSYALRNRLHGIAKAYSIDASKVELITEWG